ncbi:toxin co-regulated pilus biosynthesis Q family protein [Acinetobacter variabilis]|uniref:toxin co-regulated pilus biosynthesis Q family protein n=1 Tax=Acinetobacter variabilis TaxID=70346 RepID=UPI0028A673B0|nr:toxin co-regulated pilus biosynthesis Q family protein [Acinetobacter variabilis]
MPKGERTPLNQNGIPVELALAITRENQKMIVVNKPVISPAKRTPLQKNLAIKPETIKDIPTQFSHAKNGKVVVSPPATSAKPVSKVNAASSPFTVDRAGKTNSILPEKIKAPIVTTAPLANTKSQVNAAAPVIKPVSASTLSPKISMTPIKLNTDDAKLWVTVPGSTLRSTLVKWSADDKCSPSESWRVIWPVDIDYPMDSRLEFRGNFYEAITRLFGLYKKADQPLYIDIYKSQCILSVSDAANSK